MSSRGGIYRGPGGRELYGDGREVNPIILPTHEDAMSEKRVRAAIYTHPTKRFADRTRPAYGTPQEDGSFIEDDGTVHPPDSWFRSRPSGEDKEEEEAGTGGE